MTKPDQHCLKNITFSEFEAVKCANEVILLPFGSQEEQGPAPMGDWMLADVIADRAAREAGAFVAPTVPFGYAEYFRAVPGGIHLRAKTFVLLLTDILDNFLDHGLNKLLILNGHSGNHPLIDQVIRKQRDERGVAIPCINLWRSVPTRLWQELHPDVGQGALGHGGDPITSVYLHLFPELISGDALVPPVAKREFWGLPTSGLGAVKFNDVDVNLPLNVTDCCDDGIAGGDPSRSTAEIGGRIVEHLVNHSVAFIHHLRTVDTIV